MAFGAKLGIVAAVGLFGASSICSVCETAPPETNTSAATATISADTAIATLAIRGMTCGSCATTARIALQRSRGVYAATVSFDSASAVVRYDPARTSPDRFIGDLARLTGYQATLLTPRPTAADARSRGS